MALIGFVVNPIAGMGGRVGLKATDSVADEARRRGAEPVAPARAAAAAQEVCAFGADGRSAPNNGHLRSTLQSQH